MAREVKYRGDATGASLNFTVRNSAGLLWNTTTTVFDKQTAPVATDWALRITALAESSGSDALAGTYFYDGTWPNIGDAQMVNGWYTVDIFNGALVGDTLIGTQYGYWDGTNFHLDAANVKEVAGTTQTAGDIIGAIGNIAITGSPSYLQASSATFTAYGTEGVTSYASTDTSNGVYHTITDSGAGGSPGGEPANVLDFYYEFLLSGDETAVSVDFKGRINGSNDSILIQAWDWTAGGGTGAWSTVYTLAGTSGSTDTIRSEKLVGKYTGTLTNLGKVRIRFYLAVASTATLYVDQILIGRTITNRTVGYSDGSIWIDTVGGTAGTTPFVNGTADNPVLTWADAKTLAASTGLTSFHFLPNSSITLDASVAGYRFIGTATIALANQIITHATFRDCYTISGDSTGDDATFTNCGISTAKFDHCYFIDCRFKGVVTFLTNKDYFVIRGSDTTPSANDSATFIFAANTTCVFRSWDGGIILKGMSGTANAIINGSGRLTIDATSTAGSITLRGDFPPATGATVNTFGTSGTITQTQRYGTDQAMANTSGTTELLTRVPDATAGEVGGLAIQAATGTVQNDVALALAAYNTTGVAKEATLTTGVAVAAASKTGYSLAATGLDAITIDTPSGAIGTWNFRQRMVMLFRRFFGKAIKDTSTGTIKTYDGTTVLTTQTIAETITTETQNEAT